ncbi:MAG: hypothetical protein DMG70_25175 [Acidobacteria bacterium]|nr:MAG: hypothetical protein DMG70_25175 [Acidobacteriota bacterium]
MLPRDLKPEQFSGYPPAAKELVTNYLGALQKLPLSFLPNLLREAIDYDFKFPAERHALDRELANLGSLSPAQIGEWFQGFAKISVSTQLERSDWINSPAQFVEQLSAHLWTTHQLDAFRVAATEYADRLHAAVTPQPPPVPRLGITVIGQGVSSYDGTLFGKLRPHGGYFTHINPENGLRLLLDAVGRRAKAHSSAYGHWYIDGGEEAEHDAVLTTVSYGALASVRRSLLRNMQTETERPGMGPEALRTLMAEMRPADLGMSKDGDPIVDRFRLKLLTEGSGTQIYSTTFAQWAAREALRRAQPLTLLVRFAPRQRQRPMDELLSDSHPASALDFVGSLIDADMGAYYNWLNQQRLPGAEQSSFLVWFEGHSQALAIGPSMPRGTESAAIADLGKLLSWTI